MTGGRGFIGSHLVDALVLQGHRVLVVDDLSTPAVAAPAEQATTVEFALLDVRERAGIQALLQDWRPDAVAHLAAIASVPRSIDEPALAHDVNLNGAFAALEAARIAGVRRFVFAGSAAVYGDEPPLPCDEAAPLAPVSPYAAQKAAGELLARAYRAAWGLQTVNLRFFNVFGERQQAGSPYSGVISSFVAGMLRRGNATIYGDGGQTRDFIYVGDVALALCAALLGPDPGPEPINVARGESTSIRKLYRTLARLIGVPDEPAFAAARAGDVRHSLATVARLRERLGVEATVSVEDGLRRVVDWETGQGS